MSPDFAIIGGGVIGCAIAHALARAGAGAITVIERGQPGAEASSAAAGVLAVASSRQPRGPLYDLKCASAALFPALVDELRAAVGIDVEYARAGLIDLAFTPAEAERLQRLVDRRRERGFAVESLDPPALRAREPAVNPTVCAGAWFGDDRSLNATRLVDALQRAGAARGVEFRLAAPVTGMEFGGGRVLALTAGGERLTPGHVIVAAGAWSAELGALLRVRIPVRPDRGEMLALRPAQPVGHTLSWHDGYVVPRADGEVLIGSTSAPGVSDKEVTASSVALLLRRAVRMVPALADAALLRTWAGVRPACALRRPMIGPLRGFANVTLATGHHRSGVLLAPITAQLVAELLLQGATSLPIQPFRHRAR